MNLPVLKQTIRFQVTTDFDLVLDLNDCKYALEEWAEPEFSLQDATKLVSALALPENCSKNLTLLVDLRENSIIIKVAN